MGKLRLALRPFGRADAPLPEAHGGQALPVRRVLALLLPIGPPGPAHEEAPELARVHTCCQQKHLVRPPAAAAPPVCARRPRGGGRESRTQTQPLQLQLELMQIFWTQTTTNDSKKEKKHFKCSPLSLFNWFHLTTRSFCRKTRRAKFF